MEFLTNFFAAKGFLPHGYCFTWSPGLLWSMVGADGVIAASYFSIPLAIASLYRQRSDIAHRGVAALFFAFIMACGITHVMGIWTIWYPDYALQTATKVITAVISLVTAVALWPLIPKIARIPSVGQLQSAIASLEAEMRRRKTAEDHLHDTEQSLAITLNSIGAAFITTDAHGCIRRMNAVAECISGWTEEEARGYPLQSVLTVQSSTDSEPAVDLSQISRLVAHPEAVHHLALRSRSGTRTACELRAAPNHDPDGALRGATVLIRDVTQLEDAQVELSRLAAIVESSNDAIVSKTLDGYITSWNKGAEDMFGYTAQEAIGQPALFLIPADHADEELNILASLANGRKVPHFNTVRRRKDGSLIDVSVAISPIRDSQGRIVGGSKIARNVTQQRRAEAALREGEARLRYALAAAQMSEWELDLQTREIRRSLQHDQCFGYDSLQPHWTLQTTLDHVHPDDRQSVQAQLELALGNAGEWHVQCRVLWPDGSLHWVTLHGGTLRTPGQPDRVLGILSDSTAARTAEEARVKARQLEAENEQIQEANRIKSLFLANMSHELRTPLNAIIGFSELLQSGAVAANSPKFDEFLGHIHRSGEHLLKVINDVLDLSKVEAGKFEFDPQPLDLRDVLRDVESTVEPLRAQKRLQFAAQVQDEVATLELDPARLKQVLLNYVSNAVKFTPEGGSIRVLAMAEGAQAVRIEVHDTGIGIAAQDIPRLFSEFHQVDDGISKRHQGTGLGLALTRRLVEAQGGSVGVMSTPGQGSVFHLVLPRSTVAGAPT